MCDSSSTTISRQVKAKQLLTPTLPTSATRLCAMFAQEMTQSYKWVECFGIKFKKTVCISLTFFLPFFCTVITISPRHCVVVLIYSSKIFIILTVHLCCFLYLFTVIVPSYFIPIDLFRQNALPLLLSLYQKKQHISYHSVIYTFFQSMKNVSCFKLNINRSKAPKKMGTLKDISLFGSFAFPMDGEYASGLVAQSLAGVGKMVKKTKVQVKKLAENPAWLVRQGLLFHQSFQSLWKDSQLFPFSHKMSTSSSLSIMLLKQCWLQPWIMFPGRPLSLHHPVGLH